MNWALIGLGVGMILGAFSLDQLYNETKIGYYMLRFVHVVEVAVLLIILGAFL